MTTDLARLDTTAVATLGNASDALERLAHWVQAARDAHQLVAGLIDTAFIPDSYKPKIDPRATPEQRHAAREVAIANATAAVLQGITLGVDPLTALQQIYIVHGRPGMYAKMMVALVQAHGHEVWTEDITDTRAVVCGRRNGTDYAERITITMDQARKAGWTSNQAYAKTPQDMLWSRAAARVCDRIASDVLKGITSVEEIRDTIQVQAEVGNGHRVVKSRRTAAAALSAVAEPEPTLDVEQPDAAPEPQEPSEPGITAAQQKRMHGLLGANGLSDREAGLAYISETIGREVTSSKELTKAEARTVIEALEAVPGDDEPPLDGDWPDGPAVAP